MKDPRLKTLCTNVAANDYDHHESIPTDSQSEVSVLSTFQKLNLKNHSRLLVLNAPATFEAEIATLPEVTILRSVKGAGDVQFSLAFVTKQAEVDSLAPAIAKAATGDAVVWFAYPKGTSKRFKSEINRDNGWLVLGELGFEPVRAVAIDEDWSALRFRRVEFIKTMKRAEHHRMTAQGKARAVAKPVQADRPDRLGRG